MFGAGREQALSHLRSQVTALRFPWVSPNMGRFLIRILPVDMKTQVLVSCDPSRNYGRRRAPGTRFDEYSR
ncbi:hypothetical protein JCM9957A_13940 [Kineosporia succinea]